MRKSDILKLKEVEIIAEAERRKEREVLLEFRSLLRCAQQDQKKFAHSGSCCTCLGISFDPVINAINSRLASLEE